MSYVFILTTFLVNLHWMFSIYCRLTMISAGPRPDGPVTTGHGKPRGDKWGG